MPDLEKLKTHTSKLLNFLNENEEGCTSWVCAVSEQWKAIADMWSPAVKLHQIQLDIADNQEEYVMQSECKALGITYRKTGVFCGGGWPEYEFTGSREALLEMIGCWYANDQEEFRHFVSLITLK